MGNHSERVLMYAEDYAVFGVMLLLSLVIGIFYAIKDNKSESEVEEYFLGGRKMHYIPVGISLSLSFISAATILGVPSEIYMFGSMYFWQTLTMFMIIPVCTEIYIPVFHRLRITSSFEYLQLRFGYGIRVLATVMYLLQNILFLGVIIYTPAVASSAVTGFNMWAITLTIGIVCTLYTALGGLKAVIWTDVFQGIVVVAVMLTALFVSASEAGGWGSVWRKNWEGNRIDFLHFDFDPRYRHTFWSLTIGLGILWTSIFSTNPSQVQRYLCCSSKLEAKKSLLVAIASCLVIVALCTITGWAMFAYFYECDPIRNGDITSSDQLLPYMIGKIFRNYRGLTGLFIACVFAGCLSTVSSGINAMACVTIQDCIRPFVKWRESTLVWWSKGLVIVYGMLSTAFACLSIFFENLFPGNILQTSLSVLSIVAGPLLGIFTLGIVFPCTDSYGASSGLLVGIAISSWMYGGSLMYKLPLNSHFLGMKKESVSGCFSNNATTNGLPMSGHYNISSPFDNGTLIFTDVALGSGEQSGSGNFVTFPITNSIQSTSSTGVQIETIPDIPAIVNFYHVSYTYLSCIGFGVTLILGLFVSYVTSYLYQTGTTDSMLVRPLCDHIIFRWLPNSFRRIMRCGVPHPGMNRKKKRSVELQLSSGSTNTRNNVDHKEW